MNTSATARDVALFLDALLESSRFEDYPAALNGLQLDHRGPLRGVAAAVDFSRATISGAIEAKANMLILHHGMFWGGTSRLVGSHYEKMRMLFEHDIAVYASHLPLDAHAELGNCALLARELELEWSARFGEHRGAEIGVQGTTNVPTELLLDRAQTFARRLGGSARASLISRDHVTRRWAIVTGAGADSTALRSAAEQGIDTLIVGEGPHHTTVDAPDYGVVVIYAGHYATETLGVGALAETIAREFRIPAQFLRLPTGS